MGVTGEAWSTSILCVFRTPLGHGPPGDLRPGLPLSVPRFMSYLWLLYCYPVTLNCYVRREGLHEEASHLGPYQ